MANYLILDKDDKPLTVVQWNGNELFALPEDGAKIIQFDGAFYPGGIWDNVTKTIIDPNKQPDPPTAQPDNGESMNVLA